MLTAGALIALAVSVAPLGYLALRAAQAGVTGYSPDKAAEPFYVANIVKSN